MAISYEQNTAAEPNDHLSTQFVTGSDPTAATAATGDDTDHQDGLRAQRLDTYMAEAWQDGHRIGALAYQTGARDVCVITSRTSSKTTTTSVSDPVNTTWAQCMQRLDQPTTTSVQPSMPSTSKASTSNRTKTSSWLDHGPRDRTRCRRLATPMIPTAPTPPPGITPNPARSCSSSSSSSSSRPMLPLPAVNHLGSCRTPQPELAGTTPRGRGSQTLARQTRGT